MTETPLSISTQFATQFQPAFGVTTSTSTIDAASVEPVEENPDEYTIKCICEWPEDDGNTIYCETCNTWQHIECFYPGRAEETSHPDFAHSCADCNPRPLDRRRAIEWQQSQSRDKPTPEIGDKKTKRTATKSHKKKARSVDVQVNGHIDHDGHRNGSPHEPPAPSKKSKGHRSAQSTSSQIKRTPPFHPRQNSHIHPPSPAHTPPDLPREVAVHSYSEEFQHLYDDDTSFQRIDYNTSPLAVTNIMTHWLHDTEKLLQDTGVESEKDAFQRIKEGTKDMPPFPATSVDRRKVIIGETSHRFSSLITQVPIKPSCAIGELNGLIGFQRDYTNDPSNRWSEFVHPKPFVFFPSSLPFYIDARHEGSDCRYARRSCRPNAIVDNIIMYGRDYHFWLVSERPIMAGEQITLPWDFRFPDPYRSRYLHLLNLGDSPLPTFEGDMTDDEYEQLSEVTHRVLSEYGGCACELGKDCAFARFHRNYHGRTHGQSTGGKSKKASTSRKSKQNHVSPTSTGHATNSRAASEARQDLYDDDDNRSTSGSIRSKPRSRDRTPNLGGDANGILNEPSDREKRKLAMLEDSFRKMEQNLPQRKKKRTSEGSTQNGNNTTMPQPNARPRQKSVVSRGPKAQPGNTTTPRPKKQVDGSTTKRESRSPITAPVPSALSRSPSESMLCNGSNLAKDRQGFTPSRKLSQAEAATQTDEDGLAWFNRPSIQPRPKRRIISLSRRLLQNRLKLQPQIEAIRESIRAMKTEDDPNKLSSPAVAYVEVDKQAQEAGSNLSSPVDSRGRNPSVASTTASAEANDVNMTEASPDKANITTKPLPPPWPIDTNTANHSTSTPNHKSPNLRIQMPSAPVFPSPGVPGARSTPGSVTPASATGSLVQSPLSTISTSNFQSPAIAGAVQSPVKAPKKLSLSDYRFMRAKEKSESAKQSGTSTTSHTASAKSVLTSSEESKGLGILEGSAIVETPIKPAPTNVVENMDPPTEPTSTPA